MKNLRAVAIMTSALIGFGFSTASAVEPIKDRTIGYVMTDYFFAMYATPEKTECPEGINDGSIVQFNELYPKDKPRKLAETELVREAGIWFPSKAPEQFKFKEPVTKIAPGLNLDGKVGPNDFTSPSGEAGIDNQLYRVIGCIGDYRPGGSLRGFHNIYLRDRGYTRLLVELTNVDSLVNDDDVTVTTYRGLDRLLTDAGGNEILPNGTERVDARFGMIFHKQAHGKITNGVLTIDPADLNVPIIMVYNSRNAYFTIRNTQFKMNITAESLKGMWGGYFDIPSFYRAINSAYASYHHTYGAQSEPSVYKSLYRLADGVPDASGQNTGISGAIEINFKQAFLKHPDVPKNMTRQNTASLPAPVQR